MGNEGSKESVSTESSKSLNKGIPRVARHQLIARWRKRQLPVQLFAVARHVERADGAFALVNGGARWTQTIDFRQWPLDPPISDGGLEEARLLGRKVSELTETNVSPIHVVICSPYYRCIQTAVEICRELGPKVRMLIDRELGEVYGPTIMGHEQPTFPVRPIEHTHAYCQSHGVVCHPKLIGKWPAWPEDLKSARHRYANRFLTYLQRSTTTRRNFILVTHADCVGAALTMMPSQADHAVQSVEYGGCFVAKRIRHDCKPAEKGRRKSLPPHFARVCPTSSAEDVHGSLADVESTLAWETTQSDILAGPAIEGWLQEDADAAGLGAHDAEATLSDTLPVELPHASDGWQVHTSEIKLSEKVQAASSNAKSLSRFKKRVKTLAKNSSFSREEITKLLGALSDQPLGGEEVSDKISGGGEDECELCNTIKSPQTLTSFPTNVSLSTCLFGCSDVGDLNDTFSDQSISPQRTLDETNKEDWSILDSALLSPLSPKKKVTSVDGSVDPAFVGDSDDGDVRRSRLKQRRDNVKRATAVSDSECPWLDRKFAPLKSFESRALLHGHSAKFHWPAGMKPGPENAQRHVSVQSKTIMEQSVEPSDGSLEGRGTFSSSGKESNSSELSDLRVTLSSDCSEDRTPTYLKDLSQKRNNEVINNKESNHSGRLHCSFRRHAAQRARRKKFAPTRGIGAGSSGSGNSGVLLESLKDFEDDFRAANVVTIINSAKLVGDERKVVPLRGFDCSSLLQRRSRGNLMLHTGASVFVGHVHDHVSPQPKLNPEKFSELASGLSEGTPKFTRQLSEGRSSFGSSEGRGSISSVGNESFSSSSHNSHHSHKHSKHITLTKFGRLRMPPRSAKRTTSSWKAERSAIQARSSAKSATVAADVGIDAAPEALTSLTAASSAKSRLRYSIDRF